MRLKTPIESEVAEDAPDKGYNEIRPLIIFQRSVLINPNTQFSLLHFLGVFLGCMQSFRLLGFIVLELWRRHPDTFTHTHIDIYKYRYSAGC